MVLIKRLLIRIAYRLLMVKWWITRPVTMSVRIMLVDDGQVLMLRHTYMPYWFFPGGLIDRGETSVEAAKREAFEEVGATCHSEPRLLGVFTNYYEFQSDHIILFVCDDFSLVPSPDKWEVEEIRTFPLTNLPQDALPGTQRRVDAYLSGEAQSSGVW